MSILEIELTLEMEQRLREKAKRRRLEAEAYVQAVMLSDLEQQETEQPKHSIMELHGLGADVWKDEQGNLIDAQKYVDDLRNEWNHRP